MLAHCGSGHFVTALLGWVVSDYPTTRPIASEEARSCPFADVAHDELNGCAAFGRTIWRNEVFRSAYAAGSSL